MPVFTSKPSTDPGPFDALHPGAERGGADPTAQKNTHPPPDATDEDAELDSLFRFQEIPVSPEMRRELLGAKLPLASADQLADTQPPHKSSLSAPVGPAPLGPGFVDRHAPTEPALMRPNALPESEPPNFETPLLDGDSYSTTAPTLLSVRRRRLRNRRLVMAAIGAMLLAMFSGVAWRRYTRQVESLARDSSADRTKTPHIAGNHAASPPAARSPAASAHPATAAAAAPAPGSPVDPALTREQGSQDPKSESPDSQSAQLSLSETDATSSSPRSADSRSASRDVPRTNAPVASSSKPAAASAPDSRSSASTPIAVPRDGEPNGQAEPASKPTKGKAFDPEQLIF